MFIRALLVLFLSGALLACAEPEQASVAVVPSVKLLQVEAANQSKQRRISGKLVAADNTALSFSVSGTVQDVLVNAGQTINEGDVLAKLDKKPFDIALKQTKAKLSVARAQLTEKQQRFKRMKELLSRQVVSVSDFEVAQADLNVAKGNLRAAQAAMDDAVRNLANISLASPFTGRVVERLVDPFEEITAGKGAFSIESEGNLEVELLVPEALIHKVDYGQAVQVSFPTRKDLTIAGYISELGSQVVAGNAFAVKVQLSRNEASLRSGMSALVALDVSGVSEVGASRYLLPISALAIDAGKLALANDAAPDQEQSAPVFKYSPDSGTLTLIQVKVSDLRGNELEVYEGLQSGDLIVVAGVPFLRDGMKVKPWQNDRGLVN